MPHCSKIVYLVLWNTISKYAISFASLFISFSDHVSEDTA